VELVLKAEYQITLIKREVHKQRYMIITKLNFNYEGFLFLVQRSVFRHII